jgi:hypothetical protein
VHDKKIDINMKTISVLPAFIATMAAGVAVFAAPPKPSTPYVPATTCPAGYVPGNNANKCVPNVDPQKLSLEAARRGKLSSTVAKGVPSVAPTVSEQKAPR